MHCHLRSVSEYLFLVLCEFHTLIKFGEYPLIPYMCILHSMSIHKYSGVFSPFSVLRESFKLCFESIHQFVLPCAIHYIQMMKVVFHTTLAVKLFVYILACSCWVRSKDNNTFLSCIITILIIMSNSMMP